MIQRLTQVIRDHEGSELDYGTIRTLGMIDKEAEQLESENATLNAEIERLKAQPVRVVDEEKLKAAIDKYCQKYSRERGSHVIDIEYYKLMGILNSLAIPQPDYMGALRTLAKMEPVCANCPANCWNWNLNSGSGGRDFEGCDEHRIAYALAHPTEEIKGEK